MQESDCPQPWSRSDDFLPDAPITDAGAISAADFRPCCKVFSTDDISFKRSSAPADWCFGVRLTNFRQRCFRQPSLPACDGIRAIVLSQFVRNLVALNLHSRGQRGHSCQRRLQPPAHPPFLLSLLLRDRLAWKKLEPPLREPRSAQSVRDALPISTPDQTGSCPSCLRNRLQAHWLTGFLVVLESFADSIVWSVSRTCDTKQRRGDRPEIQSGIPRRVRQKKIRQRRIR